MLTDVRPSRQPFERHACCSGRDERTSKTSPPSTGQAKACFRARAVPAQRPLAPPIAPLYVLSSRPDACALYPVGKKAARRAVGMQGPAPRLLHRLFLWSPPKRTTGITPQAITAIPGAGGVWSAVCQSIPELFSRTLTARRTEEAMPSHRRHFVAALEQPMADTRHGSGPFRRSMSAWRAATSGEVSAVGMDLGASAFESAAKLARCQTNHTSPVAANTAMPV